MLSGLGWEVMDAGRTVEESTSFFYLINGSNPIWKVAGLGRAREMKDIKRVAEDSMSLCQRLGPYTLTTTTPIRQWTLSHRLLLNQAHTSMYMNTHVYTHTHTHTH